MARFVELVSDVWVNPELVTSVRDNPLVEGGTETLVDTVGVSLTLQVPVAVVLAKLGPGKP